MTYYYLLLIIVVLVLPVTNGILNRVLGVNVTTPIYVGMVIILLGLVLDNQKKILNRLNEREED